MIQHPATSGEVRAAYLRLIEACRRSDRAAAIAALEDADLRRELEKETEWFARAYAQWIATRSTSAVLKAEVADTLTQPTPRRLTVWAGVDFAPLIRLLDALFEKLGWLQR